MKHEKFVWVILVQLMCLKECCFSNSTQSISTEGEEGTVTINVTPSPLLNSSVVTVRIKNEKTHLELLEIFHGRSNLTGNNTTNHQNVSAVTENMFSGAENSTRVVYLSAVLSLNDTSKTNYTMTSEAIESQQDSSFWLQSTGAIAAGVFLISAVVGYFSCVGYRRFMQKKYGNSQILAGEDVYDTRDLRYFEI